MVFQRITAALESIATSLETLTKEYQSQRKEQRDYINKAMQAQSQLSIPDIFNQVQGMFKTVPDDRREIKHGS